MTDNNSTDIVTPTLTALEGDWAPVVLPANLPPAAVAAFDEYLAATSGESAEILKYKKGKWTSGANQVAIDLATQMAVDITAISDGHVKWTDRKPISSAMRRVIAGPFTPREELGDLDEDLWPTDPVSDKLRDPWARTMSVGLKDIVNWTEYLYSTSSIGGLNTLRRLLRSIRAGIAKGLTGVPIVALQSDSYVHDLYDEVFTPQLPIVAWKSEAELMGSEPDLDSELSDEISF